MRKILLRSLQIAIRNLESIMLRLALTRTERMHGVGFSSITVIPQWEYPERVDGLHLGSTISVPLFRNLKWVMVSEYEEMVDQDGT